MSEPVKIYIEVNAEDAHRYADMRLRLLLRQAVLSATATELTLDEAIQILEDEHTYLEQRIKNRI